VENRKRLKPASIILRQCLLLQALCKSQTGKPYYQILELNEDAWRRHNGNAGGRCCITKEFLRKHRGCFVAVLTELSEDELEFRLGWIIPRIDLHSSLH